MSPKSNNIRIGIFMLTAVGLFVAGLLAFGAKSVFVKKSTYETAIEGDVSGLSVGSKVLLRGVPIGKVSNIDLAPNVYPLSKSSMIVVEFQVERPIFVRDQSAEAKERRRQEEIAEGLRAMVKGQGITGTSILALEHLNPRDCPLPPPIDYTPRHPYLPSVPGQFTRMLESIERSLHNVQKLDVEAIGVGVSNVLDEVKQVLAKINRLDLERTLGKADTLLDQAKTTVATVDTTIKSMKLDTLSGDADGLVVGLKESNTKLQTVLDHLGTVPMEATVGDIRSTFQTFEEVLSELKRYPSGFIFGQPPAPAKSVEPAAKK